MDLQGHDEKLTSDMNLVLKSFQKVQGSNRDYCSNFWLNFQVTSKFGIISVRLILPKVGVDGFTGTWRESDVRKENDL